MSLFHLLFHLFVHSFFRPSIVSLFHSFIPSLTHSFIHSFIHYYTRSLIHPFIIPSTHHSFIVRSFTHHSFSHPFILSSIHSALHCSFFRFVLLDCAAALRVGRSVGVSVDAAATKMKKTVDSLKRAGWGKHRVLRPSLGYWICNPGCIWLVTLAAFGGPCPSMLAPLAKNGARAASY